VEFPVIKDWLEIEVGVSPLFRPGQTEWEGDLLFKKPWRSEQTSALLFGSPDHAARIDEAQVAR
jgi:hypothetical protein